MSRPEFYQWWRYLLRDWRHEKYFDQVIAMSLRMASYSADGASIYVSADRLAQDASCSQRYVRVMRKRAVEAGIFRPTGDRRQCSGGYIDELEIALPPHQVGTMVPAQTAPARKVGTIVPQGRNDSSPEVREGSKRDVGGTIVPTLTGPEHSNPDESERSDDREESTGRNYSSDPLGTPVPSDRRIGDLWRAEELAYEQQRKRQQRELLDRIAADRAAGLPDPWSTTIAATEAATPMGATSDDTPRCDCPDSRFHRMGCAAA